MAFRLASTPVQQKGMRRKPRVISDAMGQRKPREHDKKHLAFIACLPCVICGVRPVEVAHVRFGDAERGKPSTGMQEKPSDKWTVPLCSGHHREGPDAQHKSNESEWWSKQGIDVIALCERLYEISGELMDAAIAVMEAREK